MKGEKSFGLVKQNISLKDKHSENKKMKILIILVMLMKINKRITPAIYSSVSS
jgi:hypothetical protein